MLSWWLQQHLGGGQGSLSDRSLETLALSGLNSRPFSDACRPAFLCLIKCFCFNLPSCLSITTHCSLSTLGFASAFSLPGHGQAKGKEHPSIVYLFPSSFRCCCLPCAIFYRLRVLSPRSCVVNYNVSLVVQAAQRIAS